MKMANLNVIAPCLVVSTIVTGIMFIGIYGVGYLDAWDAFMKSDIEIKHF